MSEPEEPGALNERGRALQDAGDISGASDLTVTERDLILRCVRAAASGELFPLAEAEYRVGVKQAELKSLLASPAGIGGSGCESPGFFAVDLCLAHARDVRRAQTYFRRLPAR